MVLYLYALVSLVCLWAGLHMAYRYLWMLILLVIFNILLVSIIHNPSQAHAVLSHILPLFYFILFITLTLSVVINSLVIVLILR